MQLWPVFLTGLLAGGASCAAVQGGLLTGLIARRTPAAPAVAATNVDSAGTAAPASGRVRPGGRRPTNAKKKSKRKKQAPRPAPPGVRANAVRRAKVPAPAVPKREWRDDAAPVGGFLVGKLASHAVLGLLLGLLGDAVQLGFRTRTVTQGIAGVVMVLLALHLFGVRGLGFLVPQPPASLSRLVRRSARSQAVAAPAVLGVLTVFIPCGVTLGVMFLAVASGSPLAGMLIMSVFVLGTFPMFAALGYAAARWAAALGGKVATATAVVVLAVGVYTLNGGLTLGGAPVNAGTIVSALSGPVAAAPARAAAPPAVPPAAVHGPVGPGTAAGPQEIEIEVLDTDYRAPDSVEAGRRTVLKLVTDGTRGCTRGFVVPSLGIEKILPETGRTQIDLGVLEPGRLQFTCSMGMYRGAIDVVA